MDDAIHLERFNHDCSRDLEVNIAKLKCLHSQNLDFFLVLDLEGRVEILEFPVLMINARTMDVVDFFHRFATSSSLCESMSLNWSI
jgi:ERI1 exoribonuclease 3